MSGCRVGRWTLLIGLLASGCAAHETATAPFHPVVIAADTGLIYIYRADDPKKRTRVMPVFVDDIPLGWFSRGGYVPFHVRPGNHVLKLVVSGRPQKVAIRVEPNGEYFVRYELTPEGAILKPMSLADGRAEIAGCHLLPGGYDGRDRV
jgi:hypothetical protein